MIALGLLSLLVGATLGLLGGGGSLLTMPLLLYVGRLPIRVAIATSLLVVGATAAVSAVQHARRGAVRWRAALAFGGAGMAGAYGGGRMAALVPAQALVLAFAALMLVAAAALLVGRPEPPDRTEVSLLRLAGVGIAVGAVTGMVGAGGGFAIVPALILLGGLPTREAVGTSLVVITLQSGAALLGHLATARPDIQIALVTGAAAIAGSFIGSGLSHRLPQAALRRTFAALMVVVALVLVGGQI